MSYYTYNGQKIKYQGKFAVGPAGFYDWFLPSRDELSNMKNNVATEAGMVFGIYWTSSESTASTAIYQASGSGAALPKSNIYKVRACRQFNAPLGSYSIKDQGPAGGWIFYVDGNLYMEAAPDDLPQSAWSNITNLLIGTTGLNIGDGITNTQSIINQTGHVNSAALLCKQLFITVE